MAAPAEKPEENPGLPCLEQEDLDNLTSAWELWAQQEASPSRLLGRARVYLFFLLARFGGLRVSEISSFNPTIGIDRQTGLLELPDRRFFLPPAAMRPIRRILSLPEAAGPAFLHLDPGFLRRTFYQVAATAMLPPEKCAPRALRYGRALELLNMHIPPQQAARMLGMRNILQLDRLLEWRRKKFVKTDALFDNIFTALVEKLEIGQQSGRLLLEIPDGIHLHCLCGLEKILEVEPRAGMPSRFHIPPHAIFPVLQQIPLPNILSCEILWLESDPFEIRLKLLACGKLRLHACLDASNQANARLKKGEKIAVNIPAHMIHLLSMD